MHYRYYQLNNLSKVIATSTASEAGHKAVLSVKELHTYLCNNPHISAETWGILRSKVKAADDLYTLAYNSATAEQAEQVLKDRRYLPKIGLLKGKNTSLTSDLLREIYETSKKSVTVQEALLSRRDLPIDVLEKIDENVKMSYRVIWAFTLNENITGSWVANYFTDHPESHKTMMHRIPVLLDKYPDIIEFFLGKTLHDDESIKLHTRFELLSCLSETRHLTQENAKKIYNYVKVSKSKSNMKVKILLGLLGNPNIPTSLVNDVEELLTSKAIASTIRHHQVYNIDSLTSARRKIPGVALKPGWEYKLNNKEHKVLESLMSATQNNPARASNFTLNSDGFVIGVSDKSEQTEKTVSSKEAATLSAQPNNDTPYWTWRDAALGSIWYIDSEYASEPVGTWLNLVNLGSNWDGSIGELLQASKNL